VGTLTTPNLINVIPTATKRFREAYSAHAESTLRELNTLLLRSEVGGSISPRLKPYLLTAIGDRIQRLYVGSDSRSAYAEDGVSPLSPYATALNEAFVEVIATTVLRYQTQLRNSLPDDLFQRLALARSPNVVAENLKGLTQGFITFETPHTWLDDRGFNLSDRIWRISLDTRQRIDTLVSQGIRQGWSAAKLSRELETYLIPDATVPTKLPYGRSASFPAMRLARTEIARAGNEASLISLKLHPYYSKVDIVRSGRGDPKCPICAAHATISIGGSRTQEPYSLNDVPKVPLHPHCMCHIAPNTDEDSLNSERIRATLLNDEPFANPASGSYFISLLLGSVLSRLLPNVLARLQGEDRMT
jgi:hypothetical protein